MNKTKLTRRTWVLLGIFAVTAVAGTAVISSKSARAPKVESVQQTVTPKPGVVKTGTVQQAKAYTEIVAEYKDYRIQFDAMCQAIPNNLTYKNGTKILLDNRSGDARNISVGGVSYYLGGYGYKVITLYSKTLPKNLLINCGAAVNVGQILLQQ